MKICFVLERPELGGGVKVVFQLAELARSLGHVPEVYGDGAFPDWARAYYGGVYRDRGIDRSGGPYDLAIATYYTTVDRAEALSASRVIHFCQGYEGDFEHLAAEHERIAAVYRRPHRAFSVNPVLGRRLTREFGKASYFIPPPVDPAFHPGLRLMPRRHPLIAIPGNFEVSWKGVETCLKAAQQIQHAGCPATVIRFSLLPRSGRERSLLPDSRFLHAAGPEAVARTLRGCDLLLQGSTPTEGFGLPAMEAALSGVPVVCTDLPTMRLIGVPSRHRVPVGSDEQMAEIAMRLLSHPVEWNAARCGNLRRARVRFSARAVAARLEQALHWAVAA